jgi:exodeoxyribonuclease VII small subunit
MAGKPEAPDSPDIRPPNFEQSLAQLEALVARLESGDMPLDAALASFEQGVRLTRECQGALGAAQQKVQVLLQRGESISMEEFEPLAGPEQGATE